ncbi:MULTISPECIES: GrdX family protein [Dethiosulfovibrio]|uniref:GrdX family protein n=2 Tax=Dethiosulfovibrio TaxID=47054 RepID=A0ABS9ENX2_9BACT|nr:MULTISPECIES: GrdX family protein [Dethiosulfovibrio]MCF4113310.1 GrdX family protein [Dethiosulfovibrio russensis]MCF4142374.1 GrdX family protein [Dethiosulfovibrio marinus]MCF4145614.1 GrdX family protein [Dethiosulfovibrio acidaminovorans]
MIVVTNNEKTRDSLPLTRWVEGTALDVLDEVESMLRTGYGLVSAPLSANNRLNRSPYRSIILGKQGTWSGDDLELVDKARAFLKSQRIAQDSSADGDYRWIDADLTKTAWNEGLKLGLQPGDPKGASYE